jgi:hypothetical protein
VREAHSTQVGETPILPTGSGKSAETLRLVPWNCGSGFHRKVGALSARAPDIAVIQECANLDTLVRKSPEFAPSGALWIGDNPNRGLGVFSFGLYRLAKADTAPQQLPRRYRRT